MKKLKFDLEKALAGEPVVTRAGLEVEQLAYFSGTHSDYNLYGVIAGNIMSFLNDGSASREEQEHFYDLFMKQKTITVNGFEVPAPMSSEPSGAGVYYYPQIASKGFCLNRFWTGDSVDAMYLSRGIAHSTKEAAIAHAKAMLGIDPDK